MGSVARGGEEEAEAALRCKSESDRPTDHRRGHQRPWETKPREELAKQAEGEGLCVQRCTGLDRAPFACAVSAPSPTGRKGAEGGDFAREGRFILAP